MCEVFGVPLSFFGSSLSAIRPSVIFCATQKHFLSAENILATNTD
jgi:hypothetical protein